MSLLHADIMHPPIHEVDDGTLIPKQYTRHVCLYQIGEYEDIKRH